MHALHIYVGENSGQREVGETQLRVGLNQDLPTTRRHTITEHRNHRKRYFHLYIYIWFNRVKSGEYPRAGVSIRLRPAPATSYFRPR